MQVESCFGYNKGNLTPDPVGRSRRPDPKSSPCAPLPHICDCVHQSNCVSASKRMLFYYRHISIFVFFHVFECSLLLPCMLKSYALCVGMKMLYNTIPLRMNLFNLFLTFKTTMSKPNSLQSQKSCPCLDQVRILNNILMRAARWMAYCDLSKLNWA